MDIDLDLDTVNDAYRHEERLNSRCRHSHQKRKEKAEAVESWALPIDPQCYMCCSSNATERCLNCAARVYYCEDCSKYYMVVYIFFIDFLNR